MTTPPSFNVLGIGLSAIDIPMALMVIDQWIAHREQRYVCVLNVHCLVESRRNPPLRQIYNGAGLRTPDGMPLVWLAHWHKQPTVSRVYGPDLMLALCGVPGYRHFLYGGSEIALNALAANLERQFPGFNLVGKFSPPFRNLTSSEDEQTIALINNSQADIVWIGLGTPRQDFWIRDHRAQLNVPVLIGVGAAFDFLSGHKPQAPHWMQRHGFEWLFRLLSEPRRLWRRYLIDNPLFLLMALAQMLHLRRYEIEQAIENKHDTIESLESAGNL